jgi:hypothetical protein
MKKILLTIIAVAATGFSISSCSSKTTEKEVTDTTKFIDSSTVVIDTTIIVADTTKK